MKVKQFERLRIYTKSIAISPDDLEFIRSIKHKKSAAGKLNEIVEFYKANKKL